ncbi:hypothetical protein DFQ28_006484 [Apophysomyces sp. BC1034]|nr:hypothetical protein DFQ28_006484 [Apophysomyces sp. BC1034]
MTANSTRPLRPKSLHISPIETRPSTCREEETESIEASSKQLGDEHNSTGQKHRKTFRQNTFSWSSTSSSFSLSSTSTLSSIPTPVTAITTTTFIATMEQDAVTSMLPIFDDEEDEEEEEDADLDGAKNGDTTLDEHEIHEQRHQRRWRRRVTRSLSRAASNGDAFIVGQILTDERLRPFLNIDASDDEQDGTTPLIYAACFGKADVVQILLDAGAKVDLQDKRE